MNSIWMSGNFEIMFLQYIFYHIKVLSGGFIHLYTTKCTER